jgi:hypothetical protein
MYLCLLEQSTKGANRLDVEKSSEVFDIWPSKLRKIKQFGTTKNEISKFCRDESGQRNRETAKPLEVILKAASILPEDA